VLRCQDEIIVGGQHRQPVTDAKLRQHGIDCSELNSSTLTSVSQLSGVDVILPASTAEAKQTAQ